MQFKLEVNHEEIEKTFPTVESVKAYLSEWNPSPMFEVEDEYLDVDQFFELLKTEFCVSCYTLAMCELGDDYVEIALIVVSE